MNRVPHLVHVGRHTLVPTALFLGAAVAAGGCETSASISAGPDPVKCQVSLASPSMIDATGGTGTLTVTTQPECGWNASTAVTWISALSPASGQGTGNVEFRVAANEGESTRDGDILINETAVRVSQRAPCRFTLEPASQTIPAAGGGGGVTVATASDCAWTATTDVNWISSTTSSSGNGNGTVAFTVAANGEAERTGIVVIGGQRATVIQSGAAAQPCSYTIAPTSQSIGAAGGAGTPVRVSTRAGCGWTASSNASWVVVTSGSAGSGDGSVAFSVSANSGALRTGTLTIAGRVFTVTQAAVVAVQCQYSISPNSQDVGAQGGTASVRVSTSSGCAWTASSNDSWITITSGSSGTGDGAVSFTVGRNDGRRRNGSLTVAGRNARVEQADGRRDALVAASRNLSIRIDTPPHLAATGSWNGPCSRATC